MSLGGHPFTATASVDVLKFEDGSIWGPISLRQSSQLIGTLDGMDLFAGKSALQDQVSPIQPQRESFHVRYIQTQTIGPLLIRWGVWQDDRNQDMLVVEATTAGDKPIRGYVFIPSVCRAAHRDLTLRMPGPHIILDHGRP